MRKTLGIFVGIVLTHNISCYAQSSSDIQSYITQYKQIALEQERRFGIPAHITLAEGIL